MNIVVHVYDLSNGMARQMSPMILGKQIDAIWHTGVVAFGTEFYFGGGICEGLPRATPYGTPVRVDQIGPTARSEHEFRRFLASIAHKFTMMTYDILHNNCNNFSQECVAFLAPGSSIQQEILDLPSEALNSPFGAMLRPMLENTTRQIQSASVGHELQPLTGSPPNHLTPTTQAGSLNPVVASSHNPVTFQFGDRVKIAAKLREWDPMYTAAAQENDIQALHQSVIRLLPAQAFPALDLLRLAAATPQLDLGPLLENIPMYLDKFAGAADHAIPRPTLMMTLRLVANVLAVQTLPPREVDQALEKAGAALAHEHHLVRQAAAAVLCNIATHHSRDVDDIATRLLFVLSERLLAFDKEHDAKDPREATYLMTTLHLLISSNQETKMLAKSMEIDVKPFTGLEGVVASYANKIVTLME